MAYSRARSVPTSDNIFHAGAYFSSLLIAMLLGWGKGFARRLFALLFVLAIVFESTTAIAMLFVPRTENLWRQLLTFHVVVGWEVFIPLFFVYLFRHLAEKKSKWSQEVYHGHVAYFFARISLWAGVFSGPFPIAAVWIGRLHAWILLLAIPLVVWHVFRGYKIQSKASESKALQRRFLYNAAFGFTFFIMLFLLLTLSDRNEGFYSSPEIARMDPSPVKKSASFQPSSAQTEGGAVYRAKPMGSSEKSCGKYGCHQFIFKEWAESPHRYSANPFYQKALRLAAARHGREKVRLCQGCHDPISLFSDSLAQGKLVSEEGRKEGISCMICHSMKPHAKNIGNGSYTFALPQEFFRKAQKPFTSHTLRKEHLSLFFDKQALQDPAYCGACHRVVLPKGFMGRMHDVTLQDTYTSWKKGPFHNKKHPRFREVKICQNCHMPRTTYQERPPEFSGKAPNHRFAATNAALPVLFGHRAQLEAVKRFLQDDVLSVKIAEIRVSGNKCFVTVEVENKGTGHDFPAGPLDINQVWLEVKAVDAKGKIIFWSGSVDQRGQVDPGSRFFKVEELTKAGKEIEHHDILSVFDKKVVRMIPPLEKIRESYVFPLSDGIENLKITARVLFRKFNQRFTDWVFPGKNIQLPITTVAKDQREISL